RLMVAVVFEGYSGEEQGVRTGDIIVSIEGQSTEEMTSEDARNLLRGAPGTTVALEIEREGEPGLLSFVLTRAQIHLNNVTYKGWAGEESDGIGYLRLERFTEEAGDEVRDAVRELSEEQELKGFVLDLRGNPGGLLEAAVRVSSTFLPPNVAVVSMRGRSAGSERNFSTQGEPLAARVQLVVLVDGSSASASEIVAGAIQDHDRGVILGETTFGKGLVQVVRGLPYNTSVKITTAKYYTPSGRLIQAITYGRNGFGGTAERIPDSLRNAYQTANGRIVYDGHGIEPDVVVSLGEYSELEDALTRTAAFFLYANRFAALHEELPAGFAVDDAVLADFRDFLEEEDFTYQTRAERMLDELETDLQEADYESALIDLEDLREEIREEKDLDFERHAPRLRERLRQEILARYVGQSDQIRASLDTDPQLARALEILKNPREYREILSP
ncbi:MAG: S41 family peptidase, partial [Rubricoccaceae bacterium]|nr:S41 family peptidase [Rubricoccaceae bacterium]